MNVKRKKLDSGWVHALYSNISVNSYLLLNAVEDTVLGVFILIELDGKLGCDIIAIVCQNHMLENS